MTKSVSSIEGRLTWSNQYSTGIDLLDTVHQQILSKINHTLKSELREIRDHEVSHRIACELCELVGMLNCHAEIEDHLEKLKPIDPNNHEAHQKHHEEFQAKIKEYETELQAGLARPTQTFLLLVARDFLIHLEIEAKLFRKTR